MKIIRTDFFLQMTHTRFDLFCGGSKLRSVIRKPSLEIMCTGKSNGRSGRGRMKSCKRCCAISRIDLRGANLRKINPRKPLQGPLGKCNFGGPIALYLQSIWGCNFALYM